VSEAPDGAYERIDSSGPISADEFASGDADARAVLERAGFQGAFGNRWKSETAQGEATALAFALRDAAGAAGWLRFLRAQQDAEPGASQRDLELGDEGWEVRAEEGDVQVSILGWRRGGHVLIATIARFGPVDRADALAWARSIDARAAETG